MKKILLIAAVVFAGLFVSCNKDDDGSNKANEDIVGTWLMREDDYHFFDATFKKDGTYEWIWQGAGGKMMDSGTYEYEDKVITMTATKFQEEDYESKKMKTADMPEDWSKVRTVTIVENAGAVAWWTWDNDYFIESSDHFRYDLSGPIIMFKEGEDPGIKAPDLRGTWEIKDEDVIARLVFADNTFIQYDAWKQDTAEGGYSVSKDTGTWSLKKNVLTLNYKEGYSSFKSLGWNPETQVNEYIYYKVDPRTLEAEQWESYTQDYSTEWYIYLKDGKLYIPTQGTFSKK